MRLTRLEMSGFKSFADKVSIEFEQGVFAIVGPNGCGKSNISDAVRWVLGEQRARMLRGQKMEEVIFQGSSKRRPINVAQVSLCFDNSDGTFPIGYQEVVITRRLSRNGNSDYLINQAPVRLRDIQDLLRGTGLGSDAGVVIEAGMIERLLSDRAEERRSLFEEAAGIGFYRDRKNSTERRLDRTGDDLQRLDDLISEVQTQVRSLARQRGKAERHGKFTEERFAIVMTLARHDLKGIESRIGGFEERRKAFAVELPAAHENVEQLEREREQAMQDRASAEARRAEVERQFAQVRIDAEKLEGDINVAGERLRSATDRKNRALEEKMQAEALVVQAERELDAARAEREAAQKARESVQMELNLRTASEGETREQLSSQRTRVRELEDALQETAEATRAMTGERDALEHELEELRAQESEVTQRIQDTVEQQRTAQEEFGARQRELETRTSAVEHLARELEIARHALGAAKEREAALRSELRSQEELLSQTSARKEALERLERDRVGVAPAVKRLLESSARFEEGQIIGPLSDFINASRDQAVALERLLSEWLQAVLVKDMDAVGSVRRWHSETSPGPVILLPLEPGPVGGNGAELPRGLSVRSPAAEWIDRLLSGARTLDDAGMAVAQSNGAVFLADNSSGSGPLARRAELEALAEDLGSGTLNAERLRDELRQAEAAHAESDQRVTSLLGDMERARTALGERQLEHDDASRRLKRIGLDLRELEGTAKRLSARIESQSTRLGDVKRELTGRTEARLQFESDIAAQKSLLRELEEEQETARERRVHWQVEEAQVSAREEAAGERESRAQETLERTKRQIAELDQEVQQIDSGTSSLQDDRSLWTDTLAEQKTRERELDDARENAAEAVKKAEAKLELLEEHIAETRARQAELTEESHRLEIERVELDAERRSIVERLETEWHRPFAELLSVSEEVAGDPEALREEATRLAEQIEAIGPVNPLAMEEHREEVERLEFLTGQRDDLVEAKNALQQALREIAQTARELFVETFAAVRENFATVFATLFQGGECDLRMTDESDPLGCDIEIRAAPRGKRTQRIHLLSSGERTLVATSLLFAIYLTKPSPFCLLDEVDAPLDDSNVNRFVRLLDEFKADTQFIVITHNPRTMQVADAVYGVTMQEPGVSSIVGVRLGELQPA